MKDVKDQFKKLISRVSDEEMRIVLAIHDTDYREIKIQEFERTIEDIKLVVKTTEGLSAEDAIWLNQRIAYYIIECSQLKYLIRSNPEGWKN